MKLVMPKTVTGPCLYKEEIGKGGERGGFRLFVIYGAN
jgi:hypothetical protein